jgi:hypothetical protein
MGRESGTHGGQIEENCESDYSEDPDVNGEDNIKMDPQEIEWGRGMIWCRTGKSGGLL